MKKILLSILAFYLISNCIVAQIEYIFPSAISPIIKISVDTNLWTVDNSDGVFTISPSSSEDSNNFVCMIWASEDLTSENVFDDLAAQATAVVNTLLTDVTWAEDVTDFENNGITFVGTDGGGYYNLEDGSSLKMVTSIMFLLPDSINALALVFFSTETTYDKYENSFLNMILSIKPAQ
ncbi:MAG TPA: hypothetical protein PKN32_14190 [Bacteroidales bacterium]|nr:hypothetical protein [Bacteroidales bacterium]